MKKYTIYQLLLLSAILFTSNSFAQKKINASFYTGDWNFEVKDVPDGPLSGTLTFEQNNKKLSSYFVENINGDTIRVNKTAINDSSVTLSFSAVGQYIELTLIPKGDQQLTGTVMDTYDILANRQKD